MSKSTTPEHRSLGQKQPSVDSALSPTHAQPHQNPYKLEVGSTVQCGKPVEYGVIKWIGEVPGREKLLYAGVEMVSYVCIKYCVTIYICTYMFCI